MELLENWNKNIDLDYYNSVLNLFLGDMIFQIFIKKMIEVRLELLKYLHGFQKKIESLDLK